MGAFSKAGPVASSDCAADVFGTACASDGLDATGLSCLAVSEDGIVAVGASSRGSSQIWLLRSSKWERLAQADTDRIATLRWRGHDLFVGGNFVRLG